MANSDARAGEIDAKKSSNLAPSAFETEGRGRHDNPAAGRRRDDERPRSEIDQNSFVLGRDIRLAESGIAASLGVHMDRPREEGSGSTPNAAIPAVRLLHYIRHGESHRSTCCYPDLYAGAQGDPRGGHR
jgi:hypothetical protein